MEQTSVCGDLGIQKLISYNPMHECSMLDGMIKMLLTIRRNASETSLKFYFYAGTAFCVKGVERLTVVKQHDEVKQEWR